MTRGTLLAFASLAAAPLVLAGACANATPVVPKGKSFTCTPIAVWDGDGPIWCSEGPRIRLSGIAAREMDETCSSGHPCPAVSGLKARNELAKLLGGSKGTLPTGHIKVSAPPLKCFSKGNGVGSRTAAFCQRQDGVDLSCAMVAGGWALRWERYWGGHKCQRTK
jgi:endonuclease YncB( thermonuclease family)